MVISETNRGFTSHEHLEEVGLVHMNGRLYDARIGRMISADPFVQAALNPQNYNRYSYALNNPLAYVDPSGFFFKKIFRAVKKVAKAVFRATVSPIGFISKAFGPEIAGIVNAVGSLFCGPYAPACAAVGQFQISQEQGASFGQSLKAAGFAAASAAISNGIGNLAQSGAINVFEQAVLHGASQGGLAVAQGGKFGAAFLSGSFASLAGSVLPADIDIVSGTAVAAVIGGTASVIGGGKFANGAVTGAFVYVHNHYAHRGGGQSLDDQFNDRVSGRIFDPEQIINDFRERGIDMALTYGSVFGGGIGVGGKVGLWLATKLGPRFNPFFGKSTAQIAEMLVAKGFVPKGPNPLTTAGNFVSPKTGRSFNLDLKHKPPVGPHVGVTRPRGKRGLGVRNFPTE